MEKHGYTDGFFQMWFDWIGDAKFDFEIKWMLIAISNIITCPKNQIPNLLIQGMPDILEHCKILCQKALASRENWNGVVKLEESEIIVE